MDRKKDTQVFRLAPPPSPTDDHRNTLLPRCLTANSHSTTALTDCPTGFHSGTLQNMCKAVTVLASTGIDNSSRVFPQGPGDFHMRHQPSSCSPKQRNHLRRNREASKATVIKTDHSSQLPKRGPGLYVGHSCSLVSNTKLSTS